MNNVILYLIGFAGTGKLTIAKAILARAPFLLVDNHFINNVVFSLIDMDGNSPLPPRVWENVGKVRSIVFDTMRYLSKPARNFVLTNELVEGDEEDAKVFNPQRIVQILLAFTIVMLLATLLFALAGIFWLALLAVWMTRWMRIAMRPLVVAWANRGLAPGARATVLSMLRQAEALGEVCGGPLLGLVGTLHTVDLAHYSPGNHLSIFAIQGVQCGALICHDCRYPELYRAYKRRGVQLMFYSYHAGHIPPKRFQAMRDTVGTRLHTLNPGSTLPCITMPATMCCLAPSSGSNARVRSQHSHTMP